MSRDSAIYTPVLKNLSCDDFGQGYNDIGYSRPLLYNNRMKANGGYYDILDDADFNSRGVNSAA